MAPQAARSKEPVVVARDLRMTYTLRHDFGPVRILHVLDGIDLEVSRGETLGLVHESGCGKSTLARSIVPPTPSWGGMLADAGENSVYLVAWWLVLFPGLALLSSTLAFNILGDSLRDALDPKGHGMKSRGPAQSAKGPAK